MMEDNLSGMLFVFIVTGFVQYVLVRKRISSIADPLAYFVMTSAFSLALGCFASDDPWVVARIFVYFACFYVGFNFAAGRARLALPPIEIHGNIRQFRAVVITCCVVYVGFNALVWAKSGVILLSEDPTLQKSEAYAGGFGFVRRMNWSVGVFVLIASLYCWLWERSAIAALALMIAVLTALTGGGKGSLLPAVFGIGLFIAKPFATLQGHDDAARLRRVIPVLLSLASIPVAIVLISEHGAVLEAIDAFVVRLFYFGDVLLYWGQETVRHHFAELGPIDYVRNTFGSVLGALRMIDYDIPIGNQFVQHTLPTGVDFSESLGPNLPFYVRGELYFGPLFAPLHAFAVGFIFGRLRKLFLAYRGRSLLTYSLLSSTVAISVSLPTDEGLAVGQAFDFAMFFLPIYAVVSYFIAPVRRVMPPRLVAEAPR